MAGQSWQQFYTKDKFNMAASSGFGATTEMSRPEWSEWDNAWVLFKKDSIAGQRIRGSINIREVRVWSGGSQGEFNSVYEYATDKEIFEGNLKDSIPKYHV